MAKSELKDWPAATKEQLELRRLSKIYRQVLLREKLDAAKKITVK